MAPRAYWMQGRADVTDVSLADAELPLGGVMIAAALADGEPPLGGVTVPL